MCFSELSEAQMSLPTYSQGMAEVLTETLYTQPGTALLRSLLSIQPTSCLTFLKHHKGLQTLGAHNKLFQ